MNKKMKFSIDYTLHRPCGFSSTKPRRMVLIAQSKAKHAVVQAIQRYLRDFFTGSGEIIIESINPTDLDDEKYCAIKQRNFKF